MTTDDNNSRNKMPLCVLDGRGTASGQACDVCERPGPGTVIAAADVRHAVIQRGFNPFALGLNDAHGRCGMSASVAYQHLKSLMTADVSDWYVCERCMRTLESYLPTERAPIGTAMSVMAFVGDTPLAM